MKSLSTLFQLQPVGSGSRWRRSGGVLDARMIMNQSEETVNYVERPNRLVIYFCFVESFTFASCNIFEWTKSTVPYFVYPGSIYGPSAPGSAAAAREATGTLEVDDQLVGSYART